MENVVRNERGEEINEVKNSEDTVCDQEHTGEIQNARIDACGLEPRGDCRMTYSLDGGTERWWMVGSPRRLVWLYFDCELSL